DSVMKTSSVQRFLTISRYLGILPIKLELGHVTISTTSLVACTILCTISCSTFLQIIPWYTKSSEWYRSSESSTDKMIFTAYLSIFFVQRVLWHPMALWQTAKIQSLLESMGQLGLADSPSIFSPQFYILSIGSVVSAWTMVSVMSKDLDNLFEDSSDFRGYKYLPLNLLVQGTGTPLAAEIFTHAANGLCEIVFTVFISLFIDFHRAVRKSLTNLELHERTPANVSLLWWDKSVW
ncbi:hypothetical protein Fcan01_28260, partial [Folsomia candida]